MWRLVFGAFLGLLAGPAFAEVCDKVRPKWSPSSGPVNQLQELYFFFSDPLGIILIALSLLALFIKRTWLSIFVSMVLVVTAGLLIENWYWPEDGVTHGAYLEGCTANPLVTGIVLLVSGVIVTLFGKSEKT